MKKLLLASAYTLFLRRNSKLLTNRELRLFSATRGADVLSLHEEHCFDLILVDFKLEDMCGCTVCSLIRRDDDVPLIISCHNIPGSIERVEQSGATAMFIKPIAPFHLMETVGSFLGLQLLRSKRVGLKVNVLSKSSDRKFISLSHNISNTGLLLETENHLPIGTRIICQLTLDNSFQIEAVGVLTRCMTASRSRTFYGVEFIDLSISCRRAIDRFIDSTNRSAMNRECTVRVDGNGGVNQATSHQSSCC